LIIKCNMQRALSRGICQIQGYAYVDGVKAAEALMTAMVIDKEGAKW